MRPRGDPAAVRIASKAFDSVNAWLAPFHDQWVSSLAALGTEIARGKRQRREDVVDRTVSQRKESA